MIDPLTEGCKKTVAHTYLFDVFQGLTVKPDLQSAVVQDHTTLEPPLGFKQPVMNLTVQYVLTAEPHSPDEDPTWQL
eukprot:5107722-Amphidinium_carterae.1